MREMEEWNDGMQKEDYAGEALKVAEEKIKYLKTGK